MIEDLAHNRIEILPLNFSHTVTYHTLPLHHRDPFDRILVSQAIVENLDFISGDTSFDLYLVNHSVKRIW